MAEAATHDFEDGARRAGGRHDFADGEGAIATLAEQLVGLAGGRVGVCSRVALVEMAKSF